MKKIFFLIFFIASVMFVSCSKKEEITTPKPSKQIQEYIFNNLIEGRTSSAFERIMKTPVLYGKTRLYLCEKIYPACSGIIESSGFYSGELDDGHWVDSLLFSMEEMRMGEQMFSMLEDEASFIPPIIEDTVPEQNEASDGSEVPEVVEVEKILLDATNRLKVMEFGQERFIPVINKEETVFVHYADNKAVRYFYDSMYRLVKKEYWDMVSVKDSKITGTELYEYEADSVSPSKKIIENDNAKIVSNLNENGLVVRMEKYLNGKEQSISLYDYDEYDRLISEKCTQYIYEGEKLKTKSEKKQVFIYKSAPAENGEEDNALPPDYEYYEDNVLRTKTEYTEKDKYSTLIIFDEKDSVITYYENHIKVKDVFMSGGKEKRVKLYE